MSNAKRRMNKSGGGTDEEVLSKIRKPGLETAHPHIAQMFMRNQPEIAVELTRQLLPRMARRLGVRRKKGSRR